MESNHKDWLKFLSAWAIGTCTAVVSLIVTIVAFVLPASEPNTLGEKYFELTAAIHAVGIYRLAIVFDVATWIGWSGLFVAFAALVRTAAPVRSWFINLLGAGMLAGFIGACLRLAGIPHIASQYSTAGSAAGRAVALQSYDMLLGIINMLFSAGGLLAGVALLLIVSAIKYLPKLPRWTPVVMGIGGAIHLAKALLELTTGADLGPLALLANLLLIVALVAVSRIFYKASLSNLLARSGAN